MNVAKTLHAAMLRATLAGLWFPAAIFWRFAAWRARLQTALDNERTSHDHR